MYFRMLVSNYHLCLSTEFATYADFVTYTEERRNVFSTYYGVWVIGSLKLFFSSMLTCILLTKIMLTIFVRNPWRAEI